VKLLLGLPTAGSPTQPFLESLGKLHLPSGCDDFDRCLVTGNFIPAQRELIFEEALSRRVDFLAMIDDDIVLPSDALELLVAALQDDPQTALVGALYYSRDGLRPMAVAEWNGEDTTSALVPAFDDRSAVVVDGVGFGCTLLRMSALERMERPFLSAHVMIARKERLVRIADEDYLFCERLRRDGWLVRLHGGVRCMHYDRGTQRFSPERWEDLSVTARPRMYVRTPQGDALVEPNYSLPRNREEHRAVTLEYLLID
jgi:GT2 family glycosyltransferase